MASLGSTKPLSTPCVSISDLSQPSTSPPLFHTSSQKDPTIQTTATGEAYARPQRPSKLRNKTFTLAVLAALIIVLVMSLWQQFPTRELAPLLTSQTHASVHVQETPQPATLAIKQRLHDPEEWLRKHSSINYDAPAHNARNRPRAALISLVRNEELDGILQSMRHLEYLWNRRHNYPWIFFSETSFTDEFRAATTAATASHTSYQLIPYAHWSTPPFINTTLHHDSLTYLGALNVGKGDLLSYRHMCRWNSGFFFLHPALSSYDYYWRVEPDVHFFCHIPYDPFAFMHENDMVYGFNMNILEDAWSFPSLWKVTVEFVRAHSEFLHEGADWRWLVDDDDNAGGAGDYNNCQFFSNFEIGSLNFFRSEAYQAYFRFLDEKGGFFYERFGDAPIHTLAVNLFAKKEQTWFFKDIGYQHDAARHCPPDDEGQGRCLCEKTRLDENFYKLVPMESPQKKPPDTCLRLWLGREWLRKREGWGREIEMMVGGDGFGGYVRE